MTTHRRSASLHGLDVGRPVADLVVCTESFVVDRDLDRYTKAGTRYWAGISFIDPEHIVVRSYPRKFGAKTSKVDRDAYERYEQQQERAKWAAGTRSLLAVGGDRLRTASPLRATTLARHTNREYQRGFLPSPVSVVFTKYGRAQLGAIEWSKYRECAGGLLGWVDGKRIYIDAVVMNPAEANGSRHRVSIDRGHMRACEVDDPLDRVWIGDLHSHVIYGSDEPSETDFRGWAAGRRSQADLYVGILASPGEPDTDNPWLLPPWTKPKFGVWVARTATTGTVVVEPTELQDDRRPLWAL